MTGGLEMLDRQITLALNGFGGAFTDAVMPWISNKFVMVPLYILLLWYIWSRLGWKKTLIILLVAVLSVVVTDQTANLVKNSVQRFRPCWDDYMVQNGLKILEKKGGRYGFFSAHAATCAGIATSVLYLFRKWGGGRKERLLAALLVVWVAVVSISRVYVGKHFVGDILVGAAAGIIIAEAISRTVRWAINKFLLNL
jgi:undecaprenyl-diphosphatase